MKRFLILSMICAATLAAQNPFSADAKQAYTGIKNTITKAAEKMPEENYGFKATPDVRTYGQIIAHIADVQMTLCGIAKGEQKQQDSSKITSKAELAGVLKASFDYCDPIYDAMTDTSGAEKVKMFGRDVTKLGVLNFNTGHDNEMYGTAVVYLRLKGVVPPSSERRP